MSGFDQASWFHPAFGLAVVGLGAAGIVWRRWSFRRACQVLSAALFVGLLWLASYSGRPDWPIEIVPALSPLVGLVTSLAARALEPLLLLGLLTLAASVALGRAFCSHVCPLGTLLDLGDRAFSRRQKAKPNREAFRRARRVKYVVLAVLVGAALLGLDFLGLVDPLVLATRFAAMCFYPLLMALGFVGLDMSRPIADLLDWAGLRYLELYLPRFEGAVVMWALFLGLLLLGRLQPRFWCRHICPLGAFLGLCSARAPYRRQVSEACTGCDVCTRGCPTGAIHEGGQGTDRQECIVCLRCVRVCPEAAVEFGFAAPREPAAREPDASPALSRRGFLGSFGSGAAAGLAFRTERDHPAPDVRPRSRPHPRLIRPPGARPEGSFLSRCVRCGECLRACLTNTLQPDWYRSGLEGLWTPRLAPRHAHCEPACNVCGRVCPTQAIRPLPLAEKQHARVGTAVIDRGLCLAWAENRRCSVCDEICPLNAIYTRPEPGRDVGVPLVEQRRCIGCGTCEEACPLNGEAAIAVVAHGEIRLEEGSYIEAARERGYDFSGKGLLPDDVFGGPRPAAPQAAPQTSSQDLPPLPPGIEPDEAEALPPLPPGISEE